MRRNSELASVRLGVHPTAYCHRRFAVWCAVKVARTTKLLGVRARSDREEFKNIITLVERRRREQSSLALTVHQK